MVIKRGDLGDRVNRAIDSTPDITDRLRQAKEMANSHPMSEKPRMPDVGNAVVVFPDVGLNAHYHEVSVDLIDPNPFNARRIYRPERVKELSASILSHGQDIPGIATYRDGRYVLAAGHYRLRAIRLGGLQTMKLMVHPNLTDQELFAYSYRENAEREGQSALDNALCWQFLLDSQVYRSETDLAEVTGVSLPTVNKTLRILQLSKPVLDFVQEDPCKFSLSALYELALYEAVAKDPAATLALAVQAGEGVIGRTQIQEARAGIEAPKIRKAKETSRQYKIQRDGKQLGTVKAWDSGRIALDVVVDDERERNEVLSLLKQHFKISD